MKFIEFDKSKCDNCYKCLRVCPTKAISFREHQREIINDICIKCGICKNHCPQSALSIFNYEDQVRKAIQSSKKVIASIAPSYISAFDMKEEGQIVTALKMLGFDEVEETSYGAELVSQRYDELIENSDYENVLTSCCPAATYLVEMKYPELNKYMLPVVSPMIAHGLDIKDRYKDGYVVFIGPCLAKMAEAREMAGAIDGVLTFDELYAWLDKSEVSLPSLAPDTFGKVGSLRGKAFPLGARYCDDRVTEKYTKLRVDGIDGCEQILKELSGNKIKDYIIEVNICNGSCINGPEMVNCRKGRFEREHKLTTYIKKRVSQEQEEGEYVPATTSASLDREFTNKKLDYGIPTPFDMKQILQQTGKYRKEDELNCGACGYDTCKDKAIAVHRGWSDAKECLPYLREKAESIHSVMIENSPNGVCIVNSSLLIESFNPSFQKIFGEKHPSLKGMPTIGIFDHDLISETFHTKGNIIGRKIYERSIDKHFVVNIIYDATQNLVFGFFTDITTLEEKQKELQQLKNKTLVKTQEVIDKQMRVAQEIAGLLGETTAETKMNLMSLNELLMRGD